MWDNKNLVFIFLSVIGSYSFDSHMFNHSHFVNVFQVTITYSVAHTFFQGCWGPERGWHGRTEYLHVSYLDRRRDFDRYSFSWNNSSIEKSSIWQNSPYTTTEPRFFSVASIHPLTHGFKIKLLWFFWKSQLFWFEISMSYLNILAFSKMIQAAILTSS